MFFFSALSIRILIQSYETMFPSSALSIATFIQSFETMFPIFQHYPAMDGKPPQCFFYDTCGREVTKDHHWHRHRHCFLFTIFTFDDQQHFLQITFTTHIMICRWSKMITFWSIFQIITVGVRGSSRVCDEQRELSRNSGIFSRNLGIFLKIKEIFSRFS